MSLEKAKEAFTILLQDFEALCYVPQVGPDNDDPLASRYFGAPWMRADEAWPEIGGLPAQFVLQLNVATLPPVVRNLLGDAKLLQLFYADDRADFADDIADMACVRLVTSLDAGGSRAQPPGVKGVNGEPKVILDWAGVPEYPHPMSEAGEADFEKGVAAIDNLFGVDILKEVGGTGDDDAGDTYQGDKLSGWPWWTQGDETPLDSRGQKMIPIYQLDAGCFFDETKRLPAYAPRLFAAEGTGHIFVSSTNPNELKFLWAC